MTASNFSSAICLIHCEGLQQSKALVSVIHIMSREIRSRLGVARVLLQQTIGTIQQRTVSSSQRQALIAEISCIHLTATDAPALLELCRSVPWARVEVGDAVESALQAAVRAPRRGMQDFMAIPDYLLQLEWDHLNAETATLTSRCDLLLNRVIRNGGRCISEHSFKRVTSMLMLTSESAERLAVMSRGQKHDMNNFVKDEFKNSCALQLHQLNIWRSYQATLSSFFK